MRTSRCPCSRQSDDPRGSAARLTFLGALLLTGVLASCGRPADREPVRATAPADDIPRLPAEAAALIDAPLLRQHVEFLAHDRLRGRATPSPGLDQAAEYIRQQLRRQGLVAPQSLPDHFQRFECGDRHSGESNNVVARLPGRDPALAGEVVMVSAHYDHVGERGEGEDRIYNGANDNASGTAAMLAIARALAAAPPRRSVLFIAFCGEELGLRGSKYYVDHPVHPLDATVAQVNIEMLGRPDDASTLWIPGMTRSNLGAWLSAANTDAGIRVIDGTEIGLQEGGAFDRSDNYPLALRGVVAHSVSAGHLDELYHSPDDEADQLDYEAMVPLVRAIARGVHRLAEHEARPRWEDPPMKG